MFFRTKKSGSRAYLQVVENRWENGRSRQRIVATLGRLDQLQETGQRDALLASGARLAKSVLLLSAHAQGRRPVIKTQHIGPALIFERLWQQTGCQRVIQKLLARRRFEFDVERAHLSHRAASSLRLRQRSCRRQMEAVLSNRGL